MTCNNSEIMPKKKEKDEINLGEGEENVYSEEVREDLVESDEISPEEEGFMKGYDSEDEDEEGEKKKKEEDEELEE